MRNKTLHHARIERNKRRAKARRSPIPPRKPASARIRSGGRSNFTTLSDINHYLAAMFDSNKGAI